MIQRILGLEQAHNAITLADGEGALQPAVDLGKAGAGHVVAPAEQRTIV